MTTYPHILLSKSDEKYDWYQVEEDCVFGPILIPKGFSTDFASVPQAFWWLIPPHGRAAMPSVWHDYLYQWTQHDMTRFQVDSMWLMMLQKSGVPGWQRRLMYAYVRVLGWRNWNKFRRK